MPLKNLRAWTYPPQSPAQRQLTEPRLKVREAHLLSLYQRVGLRGRHLSHFTLTSRSMLEYSLGRRLVGAIFALSLCHAPEYQYLPEGSFYICQAQGTPTNYLALEAKRDCVSGPMRL